MCVLRDQSMNGDSSWPSASSVLCSDRVSAVFVHWGGSAEGFGALSPSELGHRVCAARRHRGTLIPVCSILLREQGHALIDLCAAIDPREGQGFVSGQVSWDIRMSPGNDPGPEAAGAPGAFGQRSEGCPGWDFGRAGGRAVSIPAQDIPCGGRPSQGPVPVVTQKAPRLNLGAAKARGCELRAPGTGPGTPGQARPPRAAPAGRARAAPAATISAFAALTHGGPAARLRPCRESRTAPAGPGAGRARPRPYKAAPPAPGQRRHGRSRAGHHRLRRGRGAAALPHRAEVRPAGKGNGRQAAGAGREEEKGSERGRERGREAGPWRDAARGGKAPRGARARPPSGRCGSSGAAPGEPHTVRTWPQGGCAGQECAGEWLERASISPAMAFVCRAEHPGVLRWQRWHPALPHRGLPPLVSLPPSGSPPLVSWRLRDREREDSAPSAGWCGVKEGLLGNRSVK